MSDYSDSLYKQSRAVNQALALVRQTYRKMGLRDAEMQHLTKMLSEAGDSLALASGSKEASRIIGEFRP